MLIESGRHRRLGLATSSGCSWPVIATRVESWTHRASTNHGLALSVRIVLACTEPGKTNLAFAARLQVSNLTVGSTG
jgi:hypothetical protein